ncbi:MAG: fumarylacetoacetate hydrolase family protein [Chloroflexaceae bacterium]
MRLVTFVPTDKQPRAGVLLGPAVIDLAAAAPLVLEDIAGLSWDMLSLLRGIQTDVSLDDIALIQDAVVSLVGSDLDLDAEATGNGSRDQGMSGSISIGGVEMLLPLEHVRLHAPLPHPHSLRMFDTFPQHAQMIRQLQGRPLPPAWYHHPAFVFGNHSSLYGPDDDIIVPGTEALDYALEIACVIGREGRDIAVDEAADYIAGYMIMNAWSARDIQAAADISGLGAVKARDFATSLGPWLVTPDELELYTDDDGRLAVNMLARVNGIEQSRGNAAGMHFSFGQMIAYASRDVMLYPGDLLSSGTVGSGCLAERTHGQGPWLAPGDIVELEITELGILRNRIV